MSTIAVHPDDAKKVLHISRRKFFDDAKAGQWQKVKMADGRIGYKVPMELIPGNSVSPVQVLERPAPYTGEDDGPYDDGAYWEDEPSAEIAHPAHQSVTQVTTVKPQMMHVSEDGFMQILQKQHEHQKDYMATIMELQRKTVEQERKIMEQAEIIKKREATIAYWKARRKFFGMF